MNILQRLSFAAALVIPIALHTGVLPAQAASLKAAEIKALIVGKTFKFWGKSKGTLSWTRTSVRYNDDKWGKGKGKWWLDGDKYCRQYLEQDAKCARFKSLGNNVYSIGPGYKLSPL